MAYRRLNRRSFLTLSGGALGAAAFLAACGSDDDEPSGAGAAPATTTGSGGSSGGGRSYELINVSYDPTRELYAQYAELFKAHYLEKTGDTVTVNNSHGGSGSQARSVVDGLDADVVTLALAGDTAVVERAGLIEPGWEAEFPYNSNPYVSTIVLLVRKGNPKGIRDWTDLATTGVGVITPNPKTSGGARWNFLAAWGTVALRGGSEDEAKQLLAGIYKNVVVMDSGARGSAQTFIERQIGDVLIAWENEALLATQDSADYEIVYPAETILAEPAVAVVDANVDEKGTRDAATEFLNHLYDPAVQELIAQNFYRPNDQEVLATFKDQYPDFDRLSNIRDFGGWAAVQEKFFADGAIFDDIYEG